MESILLTQLVGLAMAGVAQLGLVLAARSFGREHRVMSYVLIFSTVASSLCWLSLYSIPWLPWLVVALVALLGTYGAWRHRPAFPLTKNAWADGLSWAAMGAIVLFAAFPDYRKDQWNYSLAIAKRVWQFGPLDRPILNDHVYFTGFYESFAIVFRLFSSDDSMVLSAMNAFSTLLFLGLTLGLVKLVWLGKRAQPSTALITASLFFCFEDRSSLINTKPEVLLFFFTPLLVLALVRSWYLDCRRRDWFWLGVLAIAPLGLKVTWIHTLGAFGFAYLLLSARDLRRIFVGLPYLGLGALAGYLFVLPVHIKNWVFFSNVIHPAQKAFFRSSRWSEDMGAYWQGFMRPATDLSTYFMGLGDIVLSLPGRYLWLVSGSTGLFIYLWQKRHS